MSDSDARSEHQARFIVCWRMSRTDHALFPWATIGHIDYRTLNLGIMGIVAWDVWGKWECRGLVRCVVFPLWWLAVDDGYVGGHFVGHVAGSAN